MKTTTSLTTKHPLTATALAVVIALASASGFAADASNNANNEGNKANNDQPVQLTDRETVSSYDGWQDPDMSRIAVHGGRALLRHIQAASTDLSNNKVGEARAALSAADDFAQGLQLMVPYTVVVDNIRNAKHELLGSTTGVIVDDLLPIYASLDEMSEYAPELANKAKSKLDEAVKHAQAGEKQQAASKLDEIADEISSTTVYLPVLYVESQVEAANRALDQDPPNVDTAQSAIDNARASLVHATVSMHVFPDEKSTAKSDSTSTPPTDNQAG